MFSNFSVSCLATAGGIAFGFFVILFIKPKTNTLEKSGEDSKTKLETSGVLENTLEKSVKVEATPAVNELTVKIREIIDQNEKFGKMEVNVPHSFRVYF
jgi:hypothetical protein